jgi:flagellar hook-basal body complex protein FliE
MAISAAAAASAYQQVAKAAASGLTAGSGEAGQGFDQLLNQVLSNAGETGRKAEAVATQSLSNKAELVDVVTAVTQAELTLETVVAIRDKVISAYQDIMRMPI